MVWGPWEGFKWRQTSHVSYLHRLDILHQVTIWQKNFKRIVSVPSVVRWGEGSRGSSLACLLCIAGLGPVSSLLKYSLMGHLPDIF